MSLEKLVWRVIPAELRDPAEIIAMDDVLHESVSKNKIPALVLHHWQPSISLAKPQSADDVNLEKCEKYGIRVVRTTGGGRAVFHHSYNDLSYSAFFPSNGEINPIKFYDEYCMRLANAVKSLGIPVEIKNSYDFHVHGKKIGGNAQRISNGTVMQHGIILYDYSNYPLAERMVELMDNLYDRTDIPVLQSKLTWIREHSQSSLQDVYNSLMNHMTGSKYIIGSLTPEEKNQVALKAKAFKDHAWSESTSSRGWCWLPRGLPEGALVRELVS